MSDFDDLFRPGIPEDEALESLRELHKFATYILAPQRQREQADSVIKQAVSVDWVARNARNAAQGMSHGALNEAAGGSMKKVLGAVKGRAGQAAIDKRMAVHNALQGANGLRPSQIPPRRLSEPAFAKAAAYEPSRADISRMHRKAQGPQGFLGEAVGGGVTGAITGMAVAAMVAPDKYQRAAAVGGLLGAVRGALTEKVRRDHVAERGKRADGPPPSELPVTGPKPSAAPLPGIEEDEGPEAPPSEPTPEEVILAEQQGLLQQTAFENEALKSELAEAQNMAAQGQQLAEQAQMSADQASQQLQEAQMAAQQAQADAAMQLQQAQMGQQEAQMQAQMQAAQAAQNADAKMRLSIRIQQIRQQLSELASQDPVTEEGEQPQMAIQTPGQQQGQAVGPDGQPVAQDPAAAQGAQPAQAQPQGAEAAPKPKAEKKPDSPEKKAMLLVHHARLIKQASAPSGGTVSKVVNRAKDLLWKGDTARSTRAATAQTGTALGRASDAKRIAHDIHVRAPSDDSWKAYQKAQGEREAAHSAHQAARLAEGTEHLKMLGARGGAVAGGLTAAHAGVSAINRRRRQKTAADHDEHPMRGHARNAATIHGVLPGAGIAAGANEIMERLKRTPMPLMDNKSHGPISHGRRAAVALTGALAGGLIQRTGFNKRESAKDLGAIRALAKEEASRHQKAQEKEASGLSDDDLTLLFRL